MHAERSASALLRDTPTKASTLKFMLFFLLFFFSDVCQGSPGLAPKSVQDSPYISIPLQKVRLRDPTQNAMAIHRKHLGRSERRLEFMVSHGQPSEATAHNPRRRHRRRPHRAVAHNTGDILSSNAVPDVSGSDNGLAMAPKDGPNVNPQPDPSPEPESDPEVTKAQATVLPNSVPLDIEGEDIGYLATILLGTPFEAFRVLVDSGSADLWVGGDNCKGSNGGDCGKHRFLGNKSTTFRDTGRKWDINYGSGTVFGDLVTDRVGFAGLTLKNHTFGVARIESSQFTANDIPLDGVLGCAKSSLSIQRTPTLLDSLYSTGLIAQRVLSYRISRKSDGKNDGEMTVGGMDPSTYDPLSLVEVKNVNTGGFWEAKLGAIEVNGQNTGLVGRGCIFDTGTTLLMTQEADVKAIHDLIPGARLDKSLEPEAWTMPCNTTASVSLVFGGRSFAMDPRDLTYLPTNTTGICMSSIVKGGVSPTHWLVGDAFLKNIVLSTDEGKDVISIAGLAKGIY
ncbi:aspartic peptidase A1 [Mycena metata]|uniref:Aspartic peptidase A1 n=1 Tax=Mycena metata TaxID=1033252 RepID=A0AAD7IQC4_9AGAR|nr:aspartic peptidase A1 [Mycena metata]